MGNKRTNPEVLTIVPPRRRMRHDPQAPCTEKSEVDGSISLFSETSELSPLAYVKVLCDGIADSVDDGLTGKREEDNVVGKENEVEPTLAISRVRRGVCW